MIRIQATFLALATAALSLVDFVRGDVMYGVDVSYPMHHRNLTRPNPLGDDKQKFYEESIQRCVDHYGKRGQRCRENEDDRIAMSLRQPQGMVNYTQNGFAKLKAPNHVFAMIKDFWEANKDNAKPEDWPAGNTYVNHWQTPTYSKFSTAYYALSRTVSWIFIFLHL
jgi:prolyl 4-hydroxylase